MSKEKKVQVDLRVDSQDAILAHYGATNINCHVFPAGTILFKKGESRQCAFLIEKGNVQIIGNDDKDNATGPDSLNDDVLCVLGSGEIFGEMALIDSSPRSATAVTQDECRIFVIPRQTLEERLGNMDPIVSLLVSLLIERYRSTRVNLPESIKQDQQGTFIEKVSRYDSLPKELFQLRDTETQMERALEELQIQQEIRIGLKKKEFIPFLQPILALPDEKIVGFEALIRWEHPEKGLLAPFHFIPVAERTGIVQSLDHVMMEAVSEIIPEFIDRSANDDFFISVNLSGINFETNEVVSRIKNTVEKNKIHPKNIKLEITESALINDAAKAEDVLQELKGLGFKIALDDFGTGYSSLGYLHKFSIDYIKIDRAFVSEIHSGQKSIDIVRAIIGLARNFNLGVIAEGIETKEDIVALNSLGSDMGQGYFYGKPLCVEDAMAFMLDNLGK